MAKRRRGARSAPSSHHPHRPFEALVAVALDDISPGFDLELKSLRRTQRVLGLQRWLFGLAIGCFALSLSLEIDAHDGVPRVRLLMLDYPAMLGFVPAGVAFWLGYRYLRRRAGRR